MVSTGTVGISRIVMYRRERAVLLEPRGKGIVLCTLHYCDEVRDPADYFGAIDGTKIDPELMRLVTTLIEERSKPWTSGMASDPVQDRLLDIIAEKKKGKKKLARTPVQAEPAPAADNVISIMDALRKSISAETKPPKRR
jgi:DNA end-binding protein Ku